MSDGGGGFIGSTAFSDGQLARHVSAPVAEFAVFPTAQGAHRFVDDPTAALNLPAAHLLHAVAPAAAL